MKNKNPIKVSALFKGKPDINLNNSEIGNDFYDVSKDVRSFSSPSTPYEAKRKGLSYIMGISESDTQHMSEQHIKIASLKDMYDYLNVLDTHPKTKGLMHIILKQIWARLFWIKVIKLELRLKQFSKN